MPEPADLARQDQLDAEAVAILERQWRCPDCGGRAAFQFGPIDYATDTRQCEIWLHHEATCPNSHQQLRWDPSEGQAR